METSSSVKVKAYLEVQGQANQSQIRRFDLDQEVSTSFEYLRSKLASIFPDLAQNGFKIYWRDDEDDMIIISSDEELIQAMLFGRPAGLMKLYVRTENVGSNGFFPQGDCSSSNVEHTGVMCDGCNTGVRGLRFKCLVCSDYDLCSTCCDTGVHNHHYMLRLATPAPAWQGCGRRAGAGGVGRQGWWWPGLGAQQWGGAGGFPGANMKKFWRNMMRARGGNAADGTEGERPSSDAPPTAGAENMTGPGNPDAEREQQRDYLQHVGEQVSAMLEPFGVDVDVEVEERPAGAGDRCGARMKGHGKGQGKRLGGRGRQCTRGGRCKPDPNCARGGACAEGDRSACGRGGACAEGDQPACGRGGACAEGDQPACSRGGACAEGDQPTCSRGGACANTDQSVSGTGASAEVDQSQTNSGSESQSQTGDVSADTSAAKTEPRSLIDEDVDMDSGEDASWIKIEQKPVSMHVVLDPATGPDSITPTHTIPAFSLYPSLTRSSAEPSAVSPFETTPGDAATASGPRSDLDIKVAEAIEQMRAMGFHDDGGWMTAMLYHNGGDVYKVIDSVLRTAQSTRRE